MIVRFWGTRGSLPRPGPDTVRYGGNTSCVEVRTHEGTIIILDCGTGAYPLGQHLMAHAREALHGHLLITHTHWDHIQGFPFFAPLFVPGNECDVYAPRGLGRKLEETLAGQMDYAYFPVTLGALGAKVRFHDLSEGSFQIEEVHVTAGFLNHPTPTLGYRLEAGGVTVVYATDHEPHSSHLHETTGLPVHVEDVRHIEFLSDADLVIHDTMYTAEEYPSKVGWGHSSMELAIEYAQAAGARQLAFFHHDPLRTDAALEALVSRHQSALAAQGSSLQVLAAAEGQVVKLMEHEPAAPVSTLDGSFPPEPLAARQRTLLLADDSPVALHLLEHTIEPEGFRLIMATDGPGALAMARMQKPDLILMDWEMPGATGVEVARQLRFDADPLVRSIPIILITSHEEPRALAEAFAAGVTDYLTKPFSPFTLRSRVNAWLQRHGR